MAKKDFEHGGENIDKDSDTPGEHPSNDRHKNYKDESVNTRQTDVKNANASGQGSIGRNQEQTEYSSNQSADAGEEGKV